MCMVALNVKMYLLANHSNQRRTMSNLYTTIKEFKDYTEEEHKRRYDEWYGMNNFKGDNETAEDYRPNTDDLEFTFENFYGWLYLKKEGKL